jgi:bifunctional ADP-heptose synthase (sugar kinase/adenylyltransferase)
VDDIRQIDFALDMLMKRQNIEMALVTLSEAGVYIRRHHDDKAETHRIPAFLRSIADVSGAGDTVVSTAALCLASGLDAGTLAAVSNIAGGLVCEEVGVVPVNRERLMQEVIRLLA